MQHRFRFAVCLYLGLSALLTRAYAAELPDFTALVEKNNTAVVNISTSQKVAASERPQLPEGIEIPEGTPFDDFFRHYFGEQGPGGQGGPGDGNGQPSEVQSLGSGFIISADGYVITNHHVVKDADEIVVRLQDRRELVAKVVGSDKRSDIALLKIDASNLPVVKLGSPENLKVGSWVLAIGSPFGFDHSVTAGIVSAKGRSLPSDNYVPFIQTDVAINPGNSGGPLFNLDGEVVGVNSQIYSRTGGFMGLSFAIPIDVAIKVADQLKTQGRVSRGWLGVQIQDVTRELAESFGMKKPQGALVSKILPKSPAEAAGIQVGDIIIEFNKREVDTSASLPPIVGATKIGESASVKLLRQGNVKEVEIKIGALPDEEPVASAAEPGTHDVDRLGLSIANLTAEQKEQLELEQNGVLVHDVKPGPAYDAGIRRGDVILRLQDQAIKDAAQFESVVKSLPKGKSTAVLVQRRGGTLFLALKPKD
ncbi:DegQ family serine endoprotease [Methylococcus sp. EFPC2]|uniref:DegQ family serine endoprotease n=1 Tax=Methylococcus sp. EFPC2 TaxID=2812648 RepID=UPI001967F53F|nr:DegQ family serine endoprotease [Methylococcus sp. EFPC2]QSA98344.1 DegQ family serine endoprotease [Methylococcus sp. EFPC2]